MVRACLIILTLTGPAFLAAAADSTASLIETIRKVSDKGQGHKAAVAAASQLSQSPPAELPSLLKAMNDAGPLARNWLRGAFETVAARSVNDSAFPKAELIAFFNDHGNNPAIRRLAFEWIAKADPAFAGKTIPESLADPSSEMRRDAVAHFIALAKDLAAKDDKDAARTAWEKALSGASDDDQLKLISKTLKETYDQEVNLIQHNGLIVDWRLIGPFDNKGKKGFDVAYPPEKEVDFSKTYPAEFEGMTNELKWTKLTGENPEGLFDIAKLTAPHKGAITYAAHEFLSDRDQPVEFRFATPNAWKLWLNGELLFGREEYHRGMFYDMYQVRGRLKTGKNLILLKVLQNEQKEDWAQAWTFQFRACDLAGRALRPAGNTASLDSSTK
ncbi:hypothetical protein Pan44_20080 [Caulifigura coniformis]|uniref:HEAT repeat domain-containing protein n=1 Tax=Caulifigura coniformis TaxID=2527983 RepID=A0A517SCY2_9PLAN|nr:hypothetical protein [Caulifigura coniformis]QDT53981.1 hypothetical protein Pan44_20080 [Caulifigura coniformis]